MSDSKLENETSLRPLVGTVFWIAIAFSTFQIVTAAFSPISSTVVRALHVGFLLLMTFALYPGATPGGKPLVKLSWAIGLAAFALAFYHWIFEAELIQRSGELTRACLLYTSPSPRD